MKKPELINLAHTLLHRKIFDSKMTIKEIRDELLKEDLISKMIEDIHLRIGKIIIRSKVAMDKNF